MSFRRLCRNTFSPSRSPLGSKRHSSSPRARTRLLLEQLEDRVVLATLMDGGTSGLSIALAPNENLAVVSSGSTYTFSSNLDFTNGGVANTGDFSSFGGTSLTLNASGIARYTTAIDITDTSGASANDTVTFNDSGVNSYANNFNVALTNSAAGAIAFNDATRFTGSNALSASTSDLIVANPGSSITTDSGGITLSANQQTTPTSGSFVGINVNDATIQSTTGPITLEGTGGNTGSTSYGVEIQGGGEDAGDEGPGPALLSITGSANDGTSAAIAFADGAVSSAGNVTLTANGGNITELAANVGADVAGATVTLKTTGSGNQIGTAATGGGSSTPLKVNATTLLNASTSDGFITLANTTGNMPLGVLNAGAAFIELTAVGAITDGNTGTTPNIIAPNIVLTAASGIGTVLDPIPVKTGNAGNLMATVTASRQH